MTRCRADSARPTRLVRRGRRHDEAVRILLPPSEAKSAGGRGPALSELPDSAEERLTTTRRLLTDAVRRLCREAPTTAVDLLGLPPGVAEAALAANVAIRDAPTMPALDRFTGVLYDAFAPGTLPPAARRRAEDSVLVFDGAFGVLSGGEPVPDHRVPASASLPDLGSVAALWRPVLAEVLPSRLDGHLVVDLRSTDYAAMWRPPRSMAEVVSCRILVEQRAAGGVRNVVSSVPSKVGKGLLARALCTTRRRIRTRADLEAVAVAAGFEVLPTASGLDLLFRFVPKGPRSAADQQLSRTRHCGREGETT